MSNAKAGHRPGLLARLGALLALTAALNVTGCALLGAGARPAPLPQREVVGALRDRAGRVRTVTDMGMRLGLTTTSEGRTHRWPTVGGLLAFDTERLGLWLTGEKLGHEIFSLKALGDRFWLAVHPERVVFTGGPAAYAKLPRYFIHPGEVRTFFAGPAWLGVNWPGTEMAVEKDSYRFDVYLMDGLYRRVFVDRRKLVVTRIESYDVLGREVSRVELSKHAPADGTEFPRQLTIVRPRAGVTLRLRLRRPKFNKNIRPQAFQPVELDGYETIDLDEATVREVELFRTE